MLWHGISDLRVSNEAACFKFRPKYENDSTFKIQVIGLKYYMKAKVFLSLLQIQRCESLITLVMDDTSSECEVGLLCIVNKPEPSWQQIHTLRRVTKYFFLNESNKWNKETIFSSLSDFSTKSFIKTII